MALTPHAPRAILFDKDGTLFDFRKTWGAWTGQFVLEITDGPAHAAEVAAVMDYDLEAMVHRPSSPFIAGSIDDWVETILPALPRYDRDGLKSEIVAKTSLARQMPAVPLDPLLTELRGRGLPLGVATNDGIAPVTRHLEAQGIAEYFAFVAGFDSGFGPKPGPGMLLAFADAVGVAPADVAMIGDSTHDLEAAAAAGMRGVAVLTGMAGVDALAPHAEVVLPDIGHLPGWLAGFAPA